MRATYFFSFRSPYSWLASIALKKRIDAGIELELVPFFEPDKRSQALLTAKGGVFPYRVMSDAKHRYILNDIRRLTKKFNIEHKWPVDPSPWWEPSHLGFLKAEELGYGLPFFWQVYHARWQQILDISLPESIFNICKDAEIPNDIAEKIVNAPEDENIREKGAEVLYRIYLEDIFGVPMFTKKRKQFWGIDRLHDFMEMLGEPALASEEFPHEACYALDFDHAGGCG
jgi:2-hydroxychromene-2-carboxylate isomerase